MGDSRRQSGGTREDSGCTPVSTGTLCGKSRFTTAGMVTFQTATAEPRMAVPATGPGPAGQGSPHVPKINTGQAWDTARAPTRRVSRWTSGDTAANTSSGTTPRRPRPLASKPVSLPIVPGRPDGRHRRSQVGGDDAHRAADSSFTARGRTASAGSATGSVSWDSFGGGWDQGSQCHVPISHTPTVPTSSWSTARAPTVRSRTTSPCCYGPIVIGSSLRPCAGRSTGHHRGRDVDLSRHIDAVTELAEVEDLDRLTLAGFSDGGFVVTQPPDSATGSPR